MYEIFEKLCEKHNVTPYKVSKETGISRSTLSEWKKGTYTPKNDKLQLIADYFGVTLEYLMTGNEPTYYTSKETARYAQEIFENPDLRALFDAGFDSTPEDLKMATDLLKRLKGTNSDE